MKKLFYFLFLIVISISTYAQNTVWALPIKPNSTANNVNVTDVEFDASGNVFATGSFRGTVNFNFNGTATNATSAGGHDIFLAMYNSSGALQWVKTIGGSGDDAAVALDIQGTSIVIAGTFVSTSVDFDPGAGTNILSSSGLTDIFVAKFDNAGNHSWAKRSGGTQGELTTDVEFDSNSNVFVAGSFTTINDFFSNTNTQNTGGARDAFVCKLDAAGTYQWVKVIGGAGTDVSNKLTVYGNNSILLCVDIGYSAGSTTFDAGSGTASFTFSGTTGTNGIVSDFNSSGVYGNTLHFKGNSHMIKMLAFNNENIGIGTFSGTMDIDPTSGVTNVTATGASDMFMIQSGFVTSGSFIAYGVANGIGSSDAIYPTNAVMKVGTNYKTDLYITGYAKGAINFGGTSGADITGTTAADCSFEVKYNHDFAANNDFQLLYAYRNASAAGVPSGNENSHGNGIALNSTTGDVIIGGYYSSITTSPRPVVFEPGSLSVTQTFNTASMGFVQYISGCTIPNTLAVSNDYSVCAGTAATLTASGATSYSWNTGATTASITANPTTTTTYTVTGTVAGGCSKTDTVKITVNAVPNVVGVSNDYSICSPQSATLTASGATTYSWNTGATSTSITATPTTTTTYTVTGTTAGCSKSDTIKITVSAGPNVIASTNTYSTCSGQTATLTVSGATTYSWNTGSTITSFTVAPTATTTYSVTGTSGGCTKTDTVKITIKSAVVATTNPNFNCGPGTVTLGATTAAGTLEWYAASSGGSALGTGTSFTTPSIGGTTTYYVGVNNGGCLSASRTAVVATIKTIPTIPTGSDVARCGTGIVTLSASPGSLGSIFWYSSPTSTGVLSSNSSYTTPSISTTTTYYAATASGGCYSPRLPVQAIVETGAPTVAPTNTTPGANLTICSGNTTTLSASGGTTGTIKWYTASSGGTLLGSGTSYTTATLTNNTTFYAEYNNSCGGSPRTAIAVTVGANAVAPTNTTTNSTICSGSTTTVSATASGTIKWYTASTGGTLLTTGSSYTTPALTGNTTYYAENNSTCGTSSRTAVAITVNPLPNVIASATDYSICQGTNATLNASGATTYSWNTGATSASITTSPNTNTTYTLTGTTNACSKTDTVSVTVNSITLNVSPPSATICSGNGTQVIFTASGGNTYSWTGGPASPSYTVTPTTNTTYTVNATSAQGCTATSTVSVVVNQSPTTTVTNNSNVLTATINDVSYQWFDCNTKQTIPGENGQNFAPTTNGSYAVIVSDGVCADTSACTQIISTGISQNSAANNTLTINPNPAKDYFVITTPSNTPTFIQLIDFSGKIILEKTLFGNENQINTIDLSNGLYYVKALSEGSLTTTKLVINK